jgi:hypothetical protein
MAQQHEAETQAEAATAGVQHPARYPGCNQLQMDP